MKVGMMMITITSSKVGYGCSHPNINSETEFKGLLSSSSTEKSIDLQMATMTFQIKNWIIQAKYEILS